MDRHHWSWRISQLDPARDYHEIYRILAYHEFPWDMNQSLSFALYRTYAVPSIGRLLRETGEFTQRTQKRYDDTALILDTILEHRLDSPLGRSALRRMNHMHGAYDISNDDKLYVLATFVVVPIRWVAKYGWRQWTEPLYGRQLAQIRSYPEGYDVARLGTFPPGCPVPHATGTQAEACSGEAPRFVR